MVGRLNLPDVCEAEPLDMSCRPERGLDSPDSGLPPSPSPGAWLLPAGAGGSGGSGGAGAGPGGSEDEGRADQRGSMVPAVPAASLLQLQPLSYGEGIALEPLPAKEVRYTSSVRYDSERHFIQRVALQPWGQSVEQWRQTVVAVPHSTWRHYKTQLELQPRHRPHSFRSTTIVYPKKASAVFTTQLSYDGRRLARRFLSSVELEAAGCRKLPQ